MQPCAPTPSRIRCAQRLPEIDQEIKLIVFIKMMKKIAHKEAAQAKIQPQRDGAACFAVTLQPYGSAGCCPHSLTSCPDQ
jgi:hypothetical protein